jgi:geranylgeranylglycerol-phosphate geranylgeranyltransferase
VGSGFAASAAYLITADYYTEPASPWAALLVFLVTVCISSAGFIINDIHDIEIDTINRPQRPLPSGIFSLKEALLLYRGLLAVGVLLSIALGLAPLLLTVAIATVLILYSLYFKKRFMIGHISVALIGALVMPYGGLAAGHLIPFVYTMPLAFLAFIGREILKTLPDVEGDKEHGVDNVATRYGIHTAARAALACFALAAIGLTLLPTVWAMNGLYFPVLIALIYPVVGYLVYLMLRDVPRSDTAIKLSKAIFLLVVLVIVAGSL